MQNNIIPCISLDGGGIGGIFEMQWLKRLCQVAGISNLKDVVKLFCGSSIGGVCALGLAQGKSPDELLQILIDNGKNIFTYYATLAPVKSYGPVDQVTLGSVVYAPGINPYIYNNKYTASSIYDDDKPLLKVLEAILGKTRMSELSVPVITTAVKYKGGTPGTGGSTSVLDCSNIYFPYPASSISQISPVLFSNIQSSLTEGYNALCTDVALATSAASYYFPPIQMANAANPQTDWWYLDGGFDLNNPELYTYTFAQILYPYAMKYSMLSIGTGLTNIGNNIVPMSGLNNYNASVTDKLQMLPQLLDIAINVPTVSMSSAFQLMAAYNPMRLAYYRAQTQLLDKQLWALDNVTNNFPNGLKNAANEQFDRDSVKISLFLQNSGL